MSDDERLKRIATDVVRFEPTIEGAKTLADGVLRLLDERDRLAAELTAIKFAMKHEIDLATKLTERDAELAELKKGEPTDAKLMAAAVDAQRRADNYAKKLGELSTELADLRAAAADALKYAGFGEAYPFDRLPQLIRDQRTKCRNDDDRDYWRFVEEQLAAILARTPEEGR